MPLDFVHAFVIVFFPLFFLGGGGGKRGGRGEEGEGRHCKYTFRKTFTEFKFVWTYENKV